jgi:uncharacterized protein
MAAISVLWRRLDIPGHDVCRLEESDAGWRLDGTAIFGEGQAPVQLSYSVLCDSSWRTQRGQVSGYVGAKAVEFQVARSAAGIWTLNGAPAEGLGDCVDLDFGFTPGTNVLQLRRLDLIEGQAADVPVAWLDVSGGTLDLLQQRYERRAKTTYWYQAPRFGYAAWLEVTPTGFVRRYPGLWEMEP